jgi:hypothetical protein
MSKNSNDRKINRVRNMLRCSDQKIFEVGYRLRHGKLDERTVDRGPCLWPVPIDGSDRELRP